MSIIRITKDQVEKANEAYEAALKDDPEFRAFEEEQEKMREDAQRQQEEQEETK